MNKEGQGPRQRRAGSRSSDTQVSTRHTSQVPYKEVEGIERDRGLEAALGPHLTVSWRCRQWCRRPRGGSPALSRARMQAWSSGQTWRGMRSGWSRTPPRDEWAAAPRTLSIRTSSPSEATGRSTPAAASGPGAQGRGESCSSRSSARVTLQGILGSPEALRLPWQQRREPAPGAAHPCHGGLGRGDRACSGQDQRHDHQHQEPSCSHG